MKWSTGLAAVTLTVAFAGVWSVPLAGQQQPDGAALYQAQCAGCHGKDLKGAMGPPITGEGFAARWREAGFEALLL